MVSLFLNGAKLPTFLTDQGTPGVRSMGPGLSKQARKLQATLDGCNPKLRPPTDLLTGVKCRATSVAKNRCC